MNIQRVTQGGEGAFYFESGPLLVTRDGAPVDQMLEQASCLMDCVDKLCASMQDHEMSEEHVFAIQYLNEIARAMLNSTRRSCVREVTDD